MTVPRLGDIIFPFPPAIRWVDYAGLAIDPTDGSTFWGYHSLGVNESVIDVPWNTFLYQLKFV